MKNVLNEKIAKRLDKTIYELLLDLEWIQNSIRNYDKRIYLSHALTKLGNLENKYPLDFMGDVLEELTLICRELHQKKIQALAIFQN